MECMSGQEYPSKVLAMFRAVIELLNQGHDIYQLKMCIRDSRYSG